MINNRKQIAIEFRNELNAISPSMCAAKWQQVTIHLGTGQTHSCHHPSSHHIPIEEIAIDVSALHNTQFKKEQRKKMLDGIRPSECDYCWRIEDSDPTGNVFSDRITKSVEPWAKPHLNKIANSDPFSNVNPSYLEVSFSNTCNFKCSYCSPEISSKWLEEIKQYGPYPTSTKFNGIDWLKSQNRIPFLEKEYNPYVEAFWKWWPDLYPNLEVLRITGGEPLLTKNTFKVLEYILAHPRPDLELNVNSNLCVPDELFQKFINLMKQIVVEGAIKSFKLYTSCEATGSKAEYIRFGLNYDKWLSNCSRVLTEIPTSHLTVMATYNALSVTSFKEFIEDFLTLRLKHSIIYKKNLSLDISYLRWPRHQSIFILDNSYVKYIVDQLQFMKTHDFFDYEINRLERIYQVFVNQLPTSDNKIQQRDFVEFITEHDNRRGTNFLQIFPEMEDFLKTIN